MIQVGQGTLSFAFLLGGERHALGSEGMAELVERLWPNAMDVLMVTTDAAARRHNRKRLPGGFQMLLSRAGTYVRRDLKLARLSPLGVVQLHEETIFSLC